MKFCWKSNRRLLNKSNHVWLFHYLPDVVSTAEFRLWPCDLRRPLTNVLFSTTDHADVVPKLVWQWNFACDSDDVATWVVCLHWHFVKGCQVSSLAFMCAKIDYSICFRFFPFSPNLVANCTLSVPIAYMLVNTPQCHRNSAAWEIQDIRERSAFNKLYCLKFLATVARRSIQAGPILYLVIRQPLPSANHPHPHPPSEANQLCPSKWARQSKLFCRASDRWLGVRFIAVFCPFSVFSLLLMVMPRSVGNCNPSHSAMQS